MKIHVVEAVLLHADRHDEALGFSQFCERVSEQRYVRMKHMKFIIAFNLVGLSWGKQNIIRRFIYSYLLTFSMEQSPS